MPARAKKRTVRGASFRASLIALDATDGVAGGTALRLPPYASAILPSRGVAMLRGTMNGVPFHAAAEPDGNGSHWFRVDPALLQAVGAEAGETVDVTAEPSDDWVEPRVPEDLKRALAEDPPAHAAWRSTTTIARWDWVRWIATAKLADTRRRRIENACAMLKAGKRRPCCFDRAQRTLI